MKISIQGIKGAFHEEAAKNYFKSNIEIVPKITFEDVTDSIISGEADHGVVAIENTISGTIHSNLNLIKHSGLKITGEEYLQVKQNLIALPGTSIEDIQQVYSHYMAINQCRKFFRSYPNIKLIESEDTALSIKMILEKKLPNAAAIGSKLAAEYYGMQIISESIETNKNNYTRFLIISKNDDDKDYNKASLAITLTHRKGSLAIILNIISFFDINLTKIESVPIIGEPWHYLFYMDLQFEHKELYFQLLDALQALADKIEILGQYQSGMQSFNQIHKSK